MTTRIGDKARDLVKPILDSHAKQIADAAIEKHRKEQEIEREQQVRIPGILKELGKKVSGERKVRRHKPDDVLRQHGATYDPGFSEALYEWCKKEGIRVVYTPVYGTWNDYEGYPVDYHHVSLEWGPKE